MIVGDRICSLRGTQFSEGSQAWISDYFSSTGAVIDQSVSHGTVGRLIEFNVHGISGAGDRGTAGDSAKQGPIQFCSLAIRGWVMTSNTGSRDAIKTLHVADRTATIKNLLDLVAFLLFSGIAILFWKTAVWPISVLCWLIGGHFGHSKPLMFHDAAHGTLHPKKRHNDIVGFGLGTLIFVPMTVYRHAHSMHHAYLATRRDP
jgi:hypothetical protein